LDLEVKAKWDSAAQGKFVTSAMRAFRKPVARVKIPKKAQWGSEVVTTESTGGLPYDAQTKNYESPTGDPKSATPTQKSRKPNAKQKKSTALAQPNFPLSPPRQQTTAEAQQETSKAQLQQKSCPCPTQNKTTNRVPARLA
jgi:hypothetical protein